MMSFPKLRNFFKYQTSACASTMAISVWRNALMAFEVTPQSVLAFFPSYSLLFDVLKARKMLKSGEIVFWKALKMSKEQLIEPKDRSVLLAAVSSSGLWVTRGINLGPKYQSIRFFSSSSEDNNSSEYSVLDAIAKAYAKPQDALIIVLPMAKEFLRMEKALMKEKNDAVTALMKEKNDAVTALMKEKNDAVTALEKKLQTIETERNYREVDLLELVGELSPRALLERFEANFGPWHEDRSKKWGKAVVDEKFKLILEQKKINPSYAMQMGQSMYRLSSNQAHSSAFRAKLLRISTNQLLMKKGVFNDEQNQLFSAVCLYLSMHCEIVDEE
uniref:Uncharacterized protein n=1 Tax=Ditylenchus dipsaci TaxID=166011 RepID=A0A915E1F5_9BILA